MPSRAVLIASSGRYASLAVGEASVMLRERRWAMSVSTGEGEGGESVMVGEDFTGGGERGCGKGSLIGVVTMADERWGCCCCRCGVCRVTGATG